MPVIAPGARTTRSQQLQAMAQRTGLAKATVRDLLKHGWTYHETFNGVRTFQAPEGSLKPKVQNAGI